MNKGEIKAANQVYTDAHKRADQRIAEIQAELDAVRDESRSLGILQKINYDDAHNKMVKYAVLFQIKQKKEFKKAGMTWAEFCGSIGLSVSTVDRTLNDLKPFYDEFSGKMTDLLGIPFNKIRYLGRSISGKMTDLDGNALIIDGTKIPLTPENKGDIEALIDNLKETQRKQLEEKDSKIKAKSRVLEEKERVILRQEKDLAKFEREVKARGFEPGEEKFINKMENHKITIVGLALQLDPRIMPKDFTPLMTSAYIETLGHARRTFAAYYDEATNLFGDESDDDWVPPHLRVGSEEQSAGE